MRVRSRKLAKNLRSTLLGLEQHGRIENINTNQPDHITTVLPLQSRSFISTDKTPSKAAPLKTPEHQIPPTSCRDNCHPTEPDPREKPISQQASH